MAGGRVAHKGAPAKLRGGQKRLESSVATCVHVHVQLLQLCLTLCDPMDCSPPGSSARGIVQARILEWIAIPSSRDLASPGIELESPAFQLDSLPSEPPGKPRSISSPSESRLVQYGNRHWQGWSEHPTK